MHPPGPSGGLHGRRLFVYAIGRPQAAWGAYMLGETGVRVAGCLSGAGHQAEGASGNTRFLAVAG